MYKETISQLNFRIKRFSSRIKIQLKSARQTAVRQINTSSNTLGLFCSADRVLLISKHFPLKALPVPMLDLPAATLHQRLGKVLMEFVRVPLPLGHNPV
jgi:hypothetical protein